MPGEARLVAIRRSVTGPRGDKPPLVERRIQVRDDSGVRTELIGQKMPFRRIAAPNEIKQGVGALRDAVPRHRPQLGDIHQRPLLMQGELRDEAELHGVADHNSVPRTREQRQCRGDVALAGLVEDDVIEQRGNQGDAGRCR